MKPLQRLFLPVVGYLSIASILGTPLSLAQAESSTQETHEEVIERILKLREQMEALLEVLPDEVRQEVERRWQERITTPEERPEVVAGDEEPRAEDVPPAASPESESAPAVETAEAPPPCGGFHLLDSNEDALISGGDRQWRFLRLWFDGNGDGLVDPAELEGLFELGVHQIDVRLAFYINDEGDTEDVDVDDAIWLRLVGKSAENHRSGALTVDGDRLVRDGRFWLTDAAGIQLMGYQSLRSGIYLETADGQRHPLLCPEARPVNLN